MIIPSLKKSYQGQVVLDIPSWELEEGTILAVAGSNGSGKTTLAKILCGIEKPDIDVSLPDLRVGYMPQQSLGFHMSVAANLMINQDQAKSKEENRKRADALLHEIVLSDLARKNAKKLSGGETQKMALARLLMKPYDLIILDEPTASMDADSVPIAEKMIREYQEQTGCTVMIITHSNEQAKHLSGRILWLYNGKIRE